MSSESGAAIRAYGLGKRYEIGRRLEHKTARDALTAFLRNPFKGFLTKERQRATLWALKDVSFVVAPGEIVGVIGRNGAGKSTLLKILARITEPTEGTAEIRGRVGSLLEVGTGFHQELTGRDNIYLNGAVLGMSRSETKSKFDRIVDFAELADFIDTPVKHYSSGMYMRLAFAVAAHLEPEILLVDEVLAVGDASFQEKCLGRMREVSHSNRTVFFVSHSLGTISNLCQRVLYLEHGQVKRFGPAAAVVAEYYSDLHRSADTDVADVRLPGFGQECRITSVALLDSPDSTLLFGKPIALAIAAESERPFRDLTVAMSVFSTEGSCVGTMFTADSFSLSPGRPMKMRLDIPPFNLAPGSYYLGFSIGRGGLQTDRTDLDIVIGKPTVRILPVAEGRGIVADWHSKWGHVVIQGARVTVEDS
jgi:lipopolysaccharide transport system ATP-binding protein